MSDLSEFFPQFVLSPSKPIIKWVGGKTQLLGPILETFPDKIKTYYEPFIGGAAVFFALASQQRFESAHINDWNDELVNLYSVIRDCPAEFLGAIERAKFAYEMRPQAIFNYYRNWDFAAGEMGLVDRAVRTVLLNKTCFNGLYRQNKAGKFNVPWGKKEKVGMYDPNNILSCSTHLKGVYISNGDFAVAVDDAKEGDVVYMDPPYIPHSATSNFTAYTSDGFSMEDQKRVADTTRQLVARGVHVVVSNNDVPIIYDLYEGFEIRKVSARRNVNSKGDKRGPVGEVLIVGRPT